MGALLVIIFLFAIAIFGFYAAITVNKKNKLGFETFVKENKIMITKKSDPFKDGKILIYDEHKNLLWIYQTLGKKSLCFPSQSITGCELTVDDETNFKTSVSSAAGRAIVGGVLAGGVGAIIGGVTGQKKGSSVVKNMELAISTSDLNCPYVKIIVLKDSNGIKKDGIIFRTQYDLAMYWCKFIEALTKTQRTQPLS